MKNLKIIYFVILFALVALLGGGLVQAQESMTTQLQIVLEDAVNSPETVFPGALLYVSSPDLGAWSGVAGLGNIETETAIRADDKFRAGSIIKPMITVVILQLVEEWQFSLDDPMTAVLPESVTTKFAYSDQITVRMLLNHTSGMADCIGPVMNEIIADLAKVWEADEWLDVAAAQEPYFAPGEGWMYSNTDYILLGLVIEQATGRSWRESLRERIIEKLNLENTLLPEPGNLSIPGNYAHGYMDLGAGLVDVTGVDPSMADAAGGSALVTTTTDLARFLEAVLAGEFFQNTGTLAEMLTFVDIPEGSLPLSGVVGYGLGMMKFLFPDSIEMIGHMSDTAGFSSFIFHLPTQGITISGLVNDMDPSGILSRVLLPALKVLIPEVEPVLPELDPASSALQGLLDQQVQEQDIFGMAMAVRLADSTVIGKASGYSDPSGEKAWSVNTVSAIGSVTKTFTGVVVMQLIEEGKLSLDDTINTWFPEQPNGDKITIRMLLSHTSGIANYISGENVMEGKWTSEWAPMDLVTEANKLGPVSVPGSRESHYSNTNYILLGLIIEEITGNSWAQEVKSRIIEPLDLKDTTFLSTEGVWGGIMVLGYAKTPDGYISSLELPWYPHTSTVWSAGEVVSTVSDLMIFASALFDGKLVSKETLAIMAQPLGTDVDSGRIWGLGGATLDMGGLRAFGMGGDIPGYHGFFIGFLDNKLIVTALVNTQEGDVITPSLSALQYISQSLSGAPDEEGMVGNVYQDPAGRFTMPLVGDWIPVETDGTYAKFAYSDLDFAMSITTIEASDVEGDMPTAVQAVGVDPASLTEAYRGSWNKWSIFYYDSAPGKGVTVLGQVQDGVGYYVIATGDRDLTANAPEDVMKTLGGFALTGAVILPATVAEFESYVNDIVGLRPPALSIAIATTDGLIYAQGFGMADRPEGMRATPDTVYFWGSITKTVTATAIMQLREQGLVNLDAPVSDYLDYVPAEYGLTVWNLLTHSSGLPEPKDWLPQHLRLEGQPLPDFDLMDREYYAKLTELMFEPGTQSAYANPDFVTLGQIVAAVSGQPYVEYVREHILGPLGMLNTDFEYSNETMSVNAAGPTTSLSNREAMISIIDDARGLGDAASFFRETDENTAWMNHFIVGEAAGGGLMGPATEMVRYGQMMLNDGELDGVRILSAESVELFGQEQYSTSGEPLGFGMAWQIRDVPEHPYIEHGGGGEGVDALLRVYPQDGFAIALEANSGGYSRQEAMDAAANVVLTMLGGAAPQEQPAPVSTPSTGTAANTYVDPEGRFSMPLVGDWTPVETDGTYVQFAYADIPLYMSLVTVKADDLEIGVDSALRQIGIDPAALTETKRAPWDKWTVFYYTLGDGQGATVLGQTSDGTSYLIVATGEEVLTVSPPEDIMKTIEGFSLSGEVSLPTTVEAFETYVNSFFETLPSGLSMAIALEEDVLYKQGFGMADGPRGIPATPNTVYGWGSATKTVTAAAIMQLREQGLIDLDAPVSDYLDYFPTQYPITVRHLLTHSSGLPEPVDFVMVNLRLKGQPLPDFDSVVRELVEGVSELMFEPGSQSAYCNTNYMTLGQVVAAVSGQPYVEYVLEHILNPLGMTNTDFTYSNDFMEANVAAGAVSVTTAEAMVPLMDEARGLGDGADFFRETDESYTWMNPYIVGESAGGGLMGPATDMIRYAQMMLNEGELDGVRILAAESVALLQEVQTSTGGEPLGIGLAWFLGGDAEHPYIEHDGGGQGIHAKLRIYMKDGFAIAILANGPGLDRNELADAAANVVFSMLAGQ